MSKTYGGTTVLDRVDLSIRRGTIHALLGGNGSGKSTLIKILAGVVPGDSGEITVDGETHQVSQLTPHLSARLGFRFVHQDVGLIDDLTVAENIALVEGYPTGRAGRVDWRRLNSRAAALLDQFEVVAGPTELVGQLSPAQRTMVAVARALAGAPAGGSLLVLDEPTASLPDHEVDILLDYLRRRVAQGDTIIYVSHRLNEIRAIADDVTVLRDGQKVAGLPVASTDEQGLVELIAGRPVDRLYPERPADASARDVVLSVTGLTAGRLSDVSVTVRRGEIVGVAGLLGAGKSTLLRSIFGAGPEPQGGSVSVCGTSMAGLSTVQRMANGVGYVPEDRARDALMADLPISENLSIAALERHSRGGWLSKRSELDAADNLVADFKVKATGSAQSVGSLSGGNQQKVVLARWLQRLPDVLLLDEPTQGVDVVARADIYGLLDAAAQQGAGIVLASTDHEELAHVCDRVLVLVAGQVVADVSTRDIDATSIVALTYQAVNVS
ncbi:ABC transporter, ATP-binding protein [Aeromicrobium marinum DSM 15272]|uniref:ABC transporter, ATP-binding protein n=1 Tax=Aeromicrobium marinum DSM 15272 TaxID=585531 RepID=E2S889_9ACTN|nr:sugar ABC transporter ATP-binding protein [Aeromicrobium marinum]EFQ84394.1 ABC transporter, ATP-binding protein [Aeromicrobium marinum DSM 15272]